MNIRFLPFTDNSRTPPRVQCDYGILELNVPATGPIELILSNEDDGHYSYGYTIENATAAEREALLSLAMAFANRPRS